MAYTNDIESQESLDSVHADNRDYFARAENQLSDMQQTLSRQTEALSDWLVEFYKTSGLSAAPIKGIQNELNGEREALAQQFMNKTEDLNQVRQAEETLYQNLSNLFNLL